MFHHFDLHVHTQFSDGQKDLDSILKTLIKNKIKIVGFADHIFPGAMYKHKGLGITNCYSAERLNYRKEVFRLYDKKYPEIRILNGGEIDIYPHGSLSLPKGITSDFFDYLLVAKHHTIPKPINIFKKTPKVERWLWKHNPRLKLSKSLWFRGLAAAFERYHPDVFAHLQEGIPKYLNGADFKRLVYICKKNNVAIELNHFPLKKLKGLLPIAKKNGVKFSLASDFHGFSGDMVKNLNHSQEMYEIAVEYGLELIDPHDFLPENRSKAKKP
jgi:histidinol phosphatase-like PHP family hydrolase